MSRRQLLAGAGTAVGAGLLLGGTGFSLASAAGLRTPAHGGRLLASTRVAASGTVTFGSNYSDAVPKAALQAMIDGACRTPTSTSRSTPPTTTPSSRTSPPTCSSPTT